MTAYRVVIAGLKDMREITETCSKCKASVTIPMDTAPIPEICGCCGNAFNESLRNALGAYARFYRDAKNSGSTLEIAIKEDAVS